MMSMKSGLKRVALLFLVIFYTGCSVVSNRVNEFGDNLSTAIMENPDPDTVAEGLPTYLLLLDGLILNSPDNPALVRSAAQLYGAYGSAFVVDTERQKLLAHQAFNYAERAACLHGGFCNVTEADFAEFIATVEQAGVEQVPYLFSLGSTWAFWIQSHSDDWNAVAMIPRVKALMERVVVLDEGYDRGAAHLYLGVLATLVPPAAGGKPEVGRSHFEMALKLSEGQNLMAKVFFAEHYARLVFDQELHDQLLNEVLAAPVDAPGLTLMNTLAQRRAQTLLLSGQDYF